MKMLTFALATILASAPALAEPDLNRVVVSYADLDLTSAAGRTQLDRRLEDAVRAVCRAPHSRSVRVASETQACMADLREDVSRLRSRIIAETQHLAEADHKRG